MMYAFRGLRSQTGAKHQFQFPDVQIASGETVVFQSRGNTYSTDLLKILTGSNRHYQGSVFYQDQELKAWSRDYFEQIGVAMLRPELFLRLTVSENLEIARGLYQNRSESILEFLKLAGLGTHAANRIAALPEGMRRRLSLARALIHRPKVLLLEAPFSGLEPPDVACMLDLIAKHRTTGNTTVIALSDLDGNQAQVSIKAIQSLAAMPGMALRTITLVPE